MTALRNVIPMTAKSPQVEDGHIRLANELYDALIRYPFTARQYKVVLAIMRKTYGYNKKLDDLSASQIAEMVGMHRSHVTATLVSLAALKIITKTPGVYGSIVGLNKDFASWFGWPEEDKGCTKSVQRTETVQGVPNQLSGCTETVQVASTESVHTITNFPKDNLQQTEKICAPQADRASAKPARAGQTGRAMTAGLQARFDRFYQAYPRKKSRGVAERAFARLNPDDQLVDEMIAGVDRSMQSEQWRNGFIPYPASWLNAKGWLDEIQTEYTPEQRAVIDAYNEALGEALGFMDAGVFSEQRAGRINDFLTFSEKPEFWNAFFPWVDAHCELPPGVGFDYLTGRDGFTKVKGGQHERKA